MRANESWKLFRDGPVPSGRLWSCAAHCQHRHRWYGSAWVCWWVTRRRAVRIVAWLIVTPMILGILAAYWLPPRALAPIPVQMPISVVMPEAIPAAPPSPLTTRQLDCLLPRLQGQRCITAGDE
jgi:hypothetical protein